jgi:signal transduction histidine kinase/ActR/RegA family two-component response regulator
VKAVSAALATLRLAVTLAEAATRTRVSEELAAHMGVERLLVLTPDPELGVLVPAPGWPQTVRDGGALRALLANCREPRVHRAQLEARGRAPVPIVALTYKNGTVLVLIGGAPSDDDVRELALVFPMLASGLRAELIALVAEGNAAAAREASRHSQDLAAALDTTRAQLESTLRQSAMHAEEARIARLDAEHASRAKDEFLAMLGHELRNPLAPIVTALSLMKMRDDGALREERAVIERQIRHVVQLVDDLLDVSRITRGKIELRRETLSVREIVTTAAEMALPLVEERRHRMTVDVEEGLFVEGDARRLAQVLSNLLNNAAKYTPDGGLLRLRARREANLVIISVLDDGTGIDGELLPRVFEPFTQAPQTNDRAKGGLGLGLAIVKKLVELHDGSVIAKSEGRGKGSEFVVRLPASEPPTEDRVGATVLEIPARTAGTRVLVVDDNEDAGWLLGELLRAVGYEVVTATDGPSALRMLDSFVPEAALLDIGLPVMDGFELARHIRARFPSMLLVAVTGYGQPDDRAATRAAGFDAHLVKPVDIDDVTKVLERAASAPPPH